MNMARRDDFLEQLGGLMRGLLAESPRPQLPKNVKRKLVKALKIAIALLVATIVIPVAMATFGFLFGPKGTEGLIAAPLALIIAWAAILVVGLRKPRAPRVLPNASLAQLPAQTGEWLNFEREGLPWAAQQKLDTITQKLEALTPQLKLLDPKAPGAIEARRLLAEELPELVRGYQKLPAALQRKPLHGGPTPEHRLIDGLATIDDEMTRLHDRLATDDLHALATQQRYLELKYKRDKTE